MFNTFYDCSNIIEIILFVLILGSVGLSILLMFKPQIKQTVSLCLNSVAYTIESWRVLRWNRTSLYAGYMVYRYVCFLHLGLDRSNRLDDLLLCDGWSGDCPQKWQKQEDKRSCRLFSSSGLPVADPSDPEELLRLTNVPSLNCLSPPSLSLQIVQSTVPTIFK